MAPRANRSSAEGAAVATGRGSCGVGRCRHGQLPGSRLIGECLFLAAGRFPNMGPLPARGRLRTSRCRDPGTCPVLTTTPARAPSTMPGGMLTCAAQRSRRARYSTEATGFVLVIRHRPTTRTAALGRPLPRSGSLSQIRTRTHRSPPRPALRTAPSRRTLTASRNRRSGRNGMSRRIPPLKARAPSGALCSRGCKDCGSDSKKAGQPSSVLRPTGRTMRKDPGAETVLASTSTRRRTS